MSSSTTTESQVSGSRRGSLEHDRPNMLRRIVLVGKTGAGKSSSGNTILGRRAFKVAKSASSVTKECWKETGEVAERQITVVDTPGLFDTDISEEFRKHEISKCVNMTAPGPHAIVLVVQLSPFTEEERRSVEKIRAIFGEEADKHTIILFTHGDELTDSTIEEYMSDVNKDLKEVLKRCGGRYHVFNNKETEDRMQVLEFLEKVDEMVADNGGGFYTSDSYQSVEQMLKNKEEELRQYYEKKLQEMQIKLESNFQEEKRKLQATVDALTASNEGKEKIKELEELNFRNRRRMTEYKRYYETKMEEVRQEAELTQINESMLTSILSNLQNIRKQS